MELNPIVKTSLIKIDFIKRYEALSNQYSAQRTSAEERLLYIERSEVMEIIRNLGYVPKFDSREKFFKIEEEQNGKYTFGFHIILRSGSIEFVWVVKEGKEVGEIMGFLSGIFNKKEENSVEQELFAPFLQKYPPCGELQKPESEFLKMASKVVPAELIDFWQQYGFGSYGEGIIKVINPTDYMGSLYKWLGKEDFSKIPIMVTAFGDIIYYRRLSETEDDVCMLNIHYRKVEVLAYSFRDFWEKTVTDKKVMEQLLYHDLYKQAVYAKGALQKNEIFFFVPALIMGGKPAIENVDKGDAAAHMHLLFELGK